MNRRTRNNKGQFISNFDDIEDIVTASKSSVKTIWYYLVHFIKFLVIFIMLCPFLDKFRQKGLVEKALQFASDNDLGCKQCNCTVNNQTYVPEQKTGKNTNGF